MKILDRYIANAIVSGVTITLFVLLSLFGFFAFVEELRDVGQGNYGVWQAMQYVLLSLAGLAYQMFPIATLLGAIMGLGGLASNSELVVIRAAGVSLNRIIWSVLKVGFWIMALSIFLGEVVTPLAEEQAQQIRAMALNGEISSQEDGLWVKEKDNIAQIGELYSLKHLGQITVYQMATGQRVDRVVHAAQARYDGKGWMLSDVQVKDFSTGQVVAEHAQFHWRSKVTPEMLDVVTVKPKFQPIVGLYNYIEYLQANGLASGQYEMAFWGKVVTPLVTALMVVLAIPFVFGPLRSVGIGQRILVGSMVGISFYLFNQMMNYVGLVFEFNPFLSSVLPTLLFAGLAVYMVRRVH